MLAKVASSYHNLRGKNSVGVGHDTIGKMTSTEDDLLTVGGVHAAPYLIR